MYYLSFSKIRLLISSILILAFFLHGFLYYFFPEDILNSDSPIKLIKYIIVFLFLIANINKVNFARVYIFIFWAVLFLCFYLIANPLVNGKINVIASKFLPYLFPATLYLIEPIISKFNFKFYAIFILLITLISGYIEFYLLEGVFSEFDLKSDGLRISSIFINPNNAAFVIGLLHYYILNTFNYNKFSSYIFSTFLSINCLVVIIFTGSKTGLVILILNMLIFSWKYLKKYIKTKAISINSLRFFSLIIGLCFLAFTHFVFNDLRSPFSQFSLSGKGDLKTRDMSIKTGGTRLEQIIDFKNDLNNSFLFPYAHKYRWTIDNTYIQFWGDFSFIGFILLVVYIFWNLYKFFKIKQEYIYPFFIILISGFSINYLYLWPPAYLFWWYMFWQFRSDKIPKKQLI